MRYVYGITGAILLGGAAATLTLNPAGAQTAQNEPGAIPPPRRAGAPMSFANLAERLQPAVVNISTRQSVQIQRRQLPPGFEEFFRRFGGEAPQGGQGQGEGPVTQRGGSLGSGFIISADGYIVTNNHVVAPARADAVVEQITVTLTDRTEYEAEVVGRDAASDLALLKITPRQPVALRPLRRFDPGQGRRLGGRDRQSVRPRRHRHRRHRLGASPQYRRRPLRPLHPDRRLDQFGQFGRADVRPQRQRHRHRHRPDLADRRQCRHRLRHSGRAGAAR